MEQHLFILLFLPGVVLSVPHKYYLIQQGTTWKAAQIYCRTKHIDLATIESAEDMIKIQNEATRTGSNRYILISISYTWWACLNKCRRYYTDLASVCDADEHATILGKIQTNAWIGLKRGVWMWSDKTNLSTSSWMQLPDETHEYCGYLSNGVAKGAGCTEKKPFFCHRVITAQQQIIRMKVQLDQDVNDPAAKAAILEQIQKKLMDHGVSENITVKWRQQPDGKVFQIVRDKSNAVEDEVKTMK